MQNLTLAEIIALRDAATSTTTWKQYDLVIDHAQMFMAEGETRVITLTGERGQVVMQVNVTR